MLSSDSLPEPRHTEDIKPFEFVSSADFGDLPLYEFLRWHVSVCDYCRTGENKPPPGFGIKDSRHCSDYYDIVSEYSEYERVYITRGDP